ncbi:MAG: hypothetical protein HYZ36_09085, partial [Pedosphaera parvula]|nr:hypothetical protein [Pedosphaera parvula]
MDGWIYATHGYSSSPHVTSGDGGRDFGPIGSGVVRFKPDGRAFEQFSSKGGNTWGLDISRDNEVFWTQPTSGDLLMHVVLSENSLSRGRVPGTTSYSIVEKSIPVFPLIAYDLLPYVQIDQVGRFTAAAGTVIYDGGSWPAVWNHRYFTTEPTVNIVHDAVVAPAGVTYTAARAPGRETVEFVAGRDAWFRPIEVRVGPDGAVYVLDFYNQAVIHNDTRGPKHGPRNAAIRPDRDHYYGRIYRIDHKQAKKLTLPNLTNAGAPSLIQSLEHPNQHVRMSALRLLAEQSPDGILPAELASLKALVASQKSPQARVAALWALARLGRIDAATLNTAANAESEAVRKNAMMVAAEQAASANAARPAALKLLNDPNPQVRLEALEVLAAASLDPATARALVAVYPKLDDNWSRSAFLGAAAQSPATVLNAALDAGSVNSELVGQLTTLLVSAQNAGEAAKLVVSLAARPAALDDAKRAALERLAAGLGPQVVPPWNAELQRALQTLLDSGNAALSVAALPLVVRWDQGGALRASARQKVQQLLAKVGDAAQPDELRGRIAASLLGIRQIDPAIVPTVARILGSSSSASLQGRVLDAFGSLSDAAIGGQIVGAFTKLNGELQVAALNQLLKRAPWAMALLDALDAGKIDPQLLGPANVHRLRLHPSVKVAQRANTIMDKLRGPEAKEKAALIAKLTPEVEKPGDA